MSETVYLIRNRTTGLYWRGAQVRHSREVRSEWTDSTAKARHFWDAAHIKQVCFVPKLDFVTGVEVVPFTLTESSHV